MQIDILVPPAVEPISLVEAKLYARIDHDDEDTLIGDLIASARQQIEDLSGIALVERTLQIRLDDWPCAAFEGGAYSLPVTPVSAFNTFILYDEAGAPTDHSSDFRLEAGSYPRLVLTGPKWPSPLRRYGSIVIEIIAGFGASSSNIPADLKEACYLLMAYGYERRGLLQGGEDALEASGAMRLVKNWRRLRL